MATRGFQPLPVRRLEPSLVWPLNLYDEELDTAVYRGRRITIVGVRRAELNLQLLPEVLRELARQQLEEYQQDRKSR